MIESYQSQRAKELGLPEGTGKRYGTEDLERFCQDGTLEIDESYRNQFVQQFKERWGTKEQEKKLKRSPKLRDELRNDIFNHEMFFSLLDYFKGRIPASWKDRSNIEESYREAKKNGVQLGADLIRFGLIHPSDSVRACVWENQQLTPQQMAIVACMGVKSSDPKQTQKANAMAMMSIPYLPIALNNEFAGFAHRAGNQELKA